MRLWSLHPKYLDSQGLVALWRESLLAQAVLRNETTGYKNHPQLDRFKLQKLPAAAVAQYLVSVYNEASARGYHFDKSKIHRYKKSITISVTKGQINFEWNHLMHKLEKRAPELYRTFQSENIIDVHPLFIVVNGKVEDWEKV